MWEECKLKYYYHYVGKWEGYKGDLKRERLHWLSKKSNWYFLLGQLVHEVIENQISHRFLGRPVNKEAAQRLFGYLLSRVIENPTDYLVEQVNGTLSGEMDFEAIEKQGLNLLETFFQMIWPNYDRLSYEQHEKFERFIIEEIPIFLRIDLVTRRGDGSIIITDWKTQEIQELRESHQRQILVYVLWAMDKYGLSSDRVIAEIRPLPLPEKVLISVAENEKLEEFRRFILQNAAEMLSVKNEDDFPASPSRDLCEHCNYATICPDGNQFLDEEVKGELIVPGQIANT